MDEAERYQRELDTILQELEASERLYEQNRHREYETARKIFEPHINALARHNGWNEEQRQAKLNEIIKLANGQEDSD